MICADFNHGRRVFGRMTLADGRLSYIETDTPPTQPASANHRRTARLIRAENRRLAELRAAANRDLAEALDLIDQGDEQNV
jgi:hypothetical protein